MTEEEKSSGMEELKSEVKTCLICKVGKVGPVTRTKDKVDLVIYGRNVMRLARHVESRCRVHGCRAGYYYGYITYKGYTIWVNLWWRDFFPLRLSLFFVTLRADLDDYFKCRR